MQKKITLILTFWFFYSWVNAADLSVSGIYQGVNLIVENPGTPNNFCVSAVLVNGKPTKDEIQSNAFEIDFSLLEIKVGDAVSIMITHKDGCIPTIINPEVIRKTEKASFILAKIEKGTTLIWTVSGKIPENLFYIEQFKWNKWVKCAEVTVIDSSKQTSFSYVIYPHSGNNQFRVSFNDSEGVSVYSKTLKFTSRVVPVTLESAKVSDKLVFSAETQYEIFTESGTFVSEGLNMVVDVTALEKGKYWLNLDNTTLSFIKK